MSVLIGILSVHDLPVVGMTDVSGTVLPKYTARRADYPPGSHFGPRLLVDYELVWLLAGSATWSCDRPGIDEPLSVDLRVGDIALARPGFTDRFAWDARQQSVHGYLHFRLPEIPETAPDDWPLVRTAAPGGLLDGLCRYLVQVSGDGGAPALAATANATRVLLDLFVRGEAAARDSASAPVLAAVRAVRAIWRTDGMRPVALEELARAADISVGHLSRSASGDLGRGLAGALELVRLGEAAVQLQRTDHPAERIARAAGFVSPYHFSRRFALAYGTPPGRYRRYHRDDDPLAPLAAADLLWLWTELRGVPGGE